MSRARTAPRSKAGRAAERRYAAELRRARQLLAERYEARPAVPMPEPEGLYRP